MITYTTILHQAREELELTTNEYCIADIIYHLSNNPKSKVHGWCFASRQTIGKFIGITKPSVLSIIERLEEKGIVEKDEETKYLRTTEKWFNIVVITRIKQLGKENIPSVKKTTDAVKKPTASVKKTTASGKETLPYNNKDNNINNNKDNILSAKADGAKINLLIEKFKPINPSYERLFANTTQRKVLERLVKKYTFEKVGGMIDALPEIVTQKYAPQISTPITLENKLGQLLIFVKQNKKQKGEIIL